MHGRSHPSRLRNYSPFDHAQFSAVVPLRADFSPSANSSTSSWPLGDGVILAWAQDVDEVCVRKSATARPASAWARLLAVSVGQYGR